MRHILVPTDFSKPAQAALEYAVDLCRDFQGRMTLLHVSHTERVTETLMGIDAIEYLSRTLESPAATSGCAPSFDVDALRKVAQQKLAACVAATRHEDVPIETAFEEGRPSLKIVEFALENDVEMIVMGTRGRGPLAQLFLGSVAENVVRSANCPVLTVRNKPRSLNCSEKP